MNNLMLGKYCIGLDRTAKLEHYNRVWAGNMDDSLRWYDL